MTTTLQTLQELGTTLRNKQLELNNLESEVSAKKQEIKQLEEVHLPTLLDELEIEGIDLQGGGRIEVKDFIQTRISEAHKDAAFQWLRETQNDGIIKNEISVKLDRGSDERAEQIKEDLVARGVPFDQKESVHPSTLKSFITEVLNNSELRDHLPREIFGVYEGRKVVFKGP